MEHLYEKVVKLKQLYKENLSHNSSLLQENKSLKEEIYALQITINTLKEVEEFKNSVDTNLPLISESKGVGKDAKQKIDQQQIQLQLDGFIEEIDQCIQIIQAKK